MDSLLSSAMVSEILSIDPLQFIFVRRSTECVCVCDLITVVELNWDGLASRRKIVSSQITEADCLIN